MSIRVVSLNIECGKHVHRFPRVVRTLRPQVVFLQEVQETDLHKIAALLRMRLVKFVPMARGNFGISDGVWGLGCYVSADITHVREDSIAYAYPAKIPGGGVDEYYPGRHLQVVTLAHEEVPYTFLHTHFTWSPDGEMCDLQVTDFWQLCQCLIGFSSFALFGDMNAPRGINMVWDTLAAWYVDNIPSDVATTLDPCLHRIGDTPRVVDACFTCGSHVARQVALHHGVSDHKAICADIYA